jgi:hypothetical protein
MPILAESAAAGSVKASPVTKSETVKPTPATMARPTT